MATTQVELPASNYVTAIVSNVAKNNSERDLPKRPLFSQRITNASLIEQDLVGVRLVPTPVGRGLLLRTMLMHARVKHNAIFQR